MVSKQTGNENTARSIYFYILLNIKKNNYLKNEPSCELLKHSWLCLLIFLFEQTEKCFLVGNF